MNNTCSTEMIDAVKKALHMLEIHSFDESASSIDFVFKINKHYRLFFTAASANTNLSISACLPIPALCYDIQFQRLSDFISRMNKRITHGAFAFDPVNEEIRYLHEIVFHDGIPCASDVYKRILYASICCERYADGIFDVAFNQESRLSEMTMSEYERSFNLELITLLEENLLYGSDEEEELMYRLYSLSDIDKSTDEKPSADLIDWFIKMCITNECF